MSLLFFRQSQATLTCLLLATFLTVLGPRSASAEPPPYGPSQSDWGNCYDTDTNGTGGLVTVICPALIPTDSTPDGKLMANAKTSCLTMPNASFRKIGGRYSCVFVEKADKIAKTPTKNEKANVKFKAGTELSDKVN